MSIAIGFVVVALLAWTPVPARAGVPTDQLKQHVDEIVRLLQDPALKSKPAERHDRIRKIAENIFDYPDTARRALGPFWQRRSPQEKQEFVTLFADVLDRSYLSKIENYQGERVRYTGESVEGDLATVKTLVTTKKGTTIPIDYRMHEKNGRWLIYDVTIEGVSLVDNYRAQFNQIVRTQSYAALVQKLKALVAKPAPTASTR